CAPVWGDSASAEYYPYDGPAYVGQRAEPPDRVIADVQAELQQMGYYQGEVDGLLGPLTREALTAYQADQGLAPTAAIERGSRGGLSRALAPRGTHALPGRSGARHDGSDRPADTRFSEDGIKRK